MRAVLSDRGGSAAAEMALVLPLLLVLTFGPLELGNYFMNQHTLVKAVRDGARFAARQNFTNYTSCSGDVGEPALTNTKNVVMSGLMGGGGSIITPNIQADDIDVTTRCATVVGGQTMAGIYGTNPAQIVTVSATVNYRSVLSVAGFSGIGLTLNAASEAAVTGQ
jgi:Flp pilus assembly protein TadG